MRKWMESGPFIYAVAIGSLGVIQLITHNFVTGLLPVPPGLPLRMVWVYLSGILLIGTAIGMFIRRRRQPAAVFAGLLFTLFLLVVQLPKLVADLSSPDAWTTVFETVMLASGGFIIAAFLPDAYPDRPKWRHTLAALGVISRYLFASSLVVFAVLHYIYASYIQSLVPAWLPGAVVWTWLVFAGFVLSAFSLFTRLQMRLASVTLGSMYLIWVLILHAPRALHKLTVEPEWSSLCIALCVGGIAFSIALGIYRREAAAAGSES